MQGKESYLKLIQVKCRAEGGVVFTASCLVGAGYVTPYSALWPVMCNCLKMGFYYTFVIFTTSKHLKNHLVRA